MLRHRRRALLSATKAKAYEALPIQRVTDDGEFLIVPGLCPW